MNTKIAIFILSTLLLAACGKSNQDSSPGSSTGEKPGQLCVSHFLTDDQAQTIDQVMQPHLREAPELKASLLTVELVKQIGPDQTLAMLQTGLFADWLSQMNSNPHAICKTLKGESP